MKFTYIFLGNVLFIGAVVFMLMIQTPMAETLQNSISLVAFMLGLSMVFYGLTGQLLYFAILPSFLLHFAWFHGRMQGSWLTALMLFYIVCCLLCLFYQEPGHEPVDVDEDYLDKMGKASD